MICVSTLQGHIGQSYEFSDSLIFLSVVLWLRVLRRKLSTMTSSGSSPAMPVLTEGGMLMSSQRVGVVVFGMALVFEAARCPTMME